MKMKLYTVNMVVKGKTDKGAKSDMTIASLDDAMLETGFGIYNIVHMLLSGFILMGVIMQSLVMGYVMPAAQCDLNLSLQQRGWLSAIPFMAIILTSYFWGWLADTRGRRFVMLFSMIISAVFSSLASFAPEIYSFAVLSFLSSIFMSGSSAVVYTYLGEFTNLRHRDKIVTFGSSFVGIGTVMLPAISWLILPMDFSYPLQFLDISYRPWRLLVVACTLPFIISTVFLILAPESPKFLCASGRVEECLVVLKNMYVINRRMPADTYPVKAIISEAQNSKAKERSGISAILSSMKEQTVPLFKSPLLPWTCLTCFVQFGIFATTNGFYIWFPTILNSLTRHEGGQMRICDILDATHQPAANATQTVCNDSINSATFELSIYLGLIFCSMYILVGFLVGSLGKKVILVAVLTISALSGFGAHLFYNLQIAIVLFAILQMCGACIGLMNAVTVELFPTKYRAMAVCLSMMLGRVGSMAGSNLIGLFLATACGVSFYLFGGIVFVCALCCLILPGKNKGLPQTKPKAEATEAQEPA